MGLALASGHKGRRFTCFAGIRNFWLPLSVRGCLVGLASIQAPPLAAPQPLPQGPGRPEPVRLQRPHPARRVLPAGPAPSPADFRKATALLRLVCEHVATATLAELRKSDLERAQRALAELQTVTTRLRGELNGVLPMVNKVAPELEPHTHTTRVIQGALEYLHQNYSQATTLNQCADRLRLNPSYLSAQFSRIVGLPFKTYLTELRLERARELMADASRSISEIAYAVGYATENRFRLAFKNATGLSPRRWRETLRLEPR